MPHLTGKYQNMDSSRSLVQESMCHSLPLLLFFRESYGMQIFRGGMTITCLEILILSGIVDLVVEVNGFMELIRHQTWIDGEVCGSRHGINNCLRFHLVWRPENLLNIISLTNEKFIFRLSTIAQAQKVRLYNYYGGLFIFCIVMGNKIKSVTILFVFHGRVGLMAVYECMFARNSSFAGCSTPPKGRVER